MRSPRRFEMGRSRMTPPTVNMKVTGTMIATNASQSMRFLGAASRTLGHYARATGRVSAYLPHQVHDRQGMPIMRRLFTLPALVLLAACGNANSQADASEAGVLADGQALPTVVVYKTATCG